MKKRILFFSLLLITAAAYAQTELPSDSVRRSPAGNYKEFGGFLLDMGLMAVQAPKVPKYNFDLGKPTTDYNKLFSLDPNVTMTQGLSTLFTDYGSGCGGFGAFGGFGSSSEQLQMSSFKLKNGMRISTYGQYNAEGYRVPSRSALPWEKNAFKGAFELKSGNGAFGIRIEVQQGGGSYYP